MGWSKTYLLWSAIKNKTTIGAEVKMPVWFAAPIKDSHIAYAKLFLRLKKAYGIKVNKSVIEKIIISEGVFEKINLPCNNNVTKPYASHAKEIYEKFVDLDREDRRAHAHDKIDGVWYDFFFVRETVPGKEEICAEMSKQYDLDWVVKLCICAKLVEGVKPLLITESMINEMLSRWPFYIICFKSIALHQVQE